MTGSTTRTKKQWRPAGLTFTLETFYKHWIGCYSNDIMWCVCLCTHGKSFAKALGKCVWVLCLTLSLRSAVYTVVSQRWRLAKHLTEETEESSHRRLEQHSHTHTFIPLPAPLSASLASGRCVPKSQWPKPGGASGVVKAVMCNATQTHSGLRTHHSPGGMLHTSHPEPLHRPMGGWK